MTAVIACGSDSAPGASGSSGEGTASSGIASGSAASDTQGEPEQSAAGGLDSACVELVLGRAATSFTDITDAERTRIFEQCSTAGPGQPGSRLAAGFDVECIEGVVGETETDFSQLNPEQRQAVFEECGGGDFGGQQFPGGARPAGGAGAATEGLANLLQNECVQDAIGRPVTDPSELNQQEIFTAIQQCSESLQLPAGGFGDRGGFGGGAGGPGGFGRPPRASGN